MAPDSAKPFTCAFDLLAEGQRDWQPEPPPLQLIPMTGDQTKPGRGWIRRTRWSESKGLLVKANDKPYRPGRTGDWRKIRHTVLSTRW